MTFLRILAIIYLAVAEWALFNGARRAENPKHRKAGTIFVLLMVVATWIK